MAVCPLCLSEKHLTHQVVNILEEQKHKLTDKIDGIKGRLKLYHGQILAAKQHAEHDFNTKIKLLKDSKKETTQKNLTTKLADAIENLATLNDIEVKVKQDTTQTDIANKMEFVDIVDGLTKQSQEPIAYKCFDLVEKKALHDSFSVLPLNESEETRINKYVTKGMLYFFLVRVGTKKSGRGKVTRSIKILIRSSMSFSHNTVLKECINLIYVQCNILICLHFQVHIRDVHKQNLHICPYQQNSAFSMFYSI